MNDLFRSAQKKAYEIEGAINDLYCDKVTLTDQTTQQMQTKMDLLNGQIAELERLLAKELKPNDSTFGFWQTKLDKLIKLRDSLPANLEKALRRKKSNAQPYSRGGSSSAERLQQEMRNNESLLRSNNLADSIKRDGNTILSSLMIQEETLKRVKVRSLQMLQ